MEEVPLFHGTPISNLLGIAKHGLEPRLASWHVRDKGDAAFPAVYLSPSINVAKQYGIEGGESFSFAENEAIQKQIKRLQAPRVDKLAQLELQFQHLTHGHTPRTWMPNPNDPRYNELMKIKQTIVLETARIQLDGERALQSLSRHRPDASAILRADANQLVGRFSPATVNEAAYFKAIPIDQKDNFKNVVSRTRILQAEVPKYVNNLEEVSLIGKIHPSELSAKLIGGTAGELEPILKRSWTPIRQFVKLLPKVGIPLLGVLAAMGISSALSSDEKARG